MNYERNNSNNFSLANLSSSITPILNIDPDATRTLGDIEPPGSTQFWLIADLQQNAPEKAT